MRSPTPHPIYPPPQSPCPNPPRSILDTIPLIFPAVLKGPLAFFSNTPPTGFTRSGYCEVPAGDFGNHAVAAEVTEEFLDFTASRGNDLRIAGLKGGCKWCLCAGRWLEAFQERKSDSDAVVPKVFLESTHEKALKSVG